MLGVGEGGAGSGCVRTEQQAEEASGERRTSISPVTHRLLKLTSPCEAADTSRPLTALLQSFTSTTRSPPPPLFPTLFRFSPFQSTSPASRGQGTTHGYRRAASWMQGARSEQQRAGEQPKGRIEVLLADLGRVLQYVQRSYFLSRPAY